MVIQVMVVNIGYFGKSANSGESSDFDDSRDTSEICVQICYFGEIGVSRKYGDSGDGCEYCNPGDFGHSCQYGDSGDSSDFGDYDVSGGLTHNYVLLSSSGRNKCSVGFLVCMILKALISFFKKVVFIFGTESYVFSKICK